MSGGPNRDDDYLWDRSGPVDAEVARFERLLAPLAWDGRPRMESGAGQQASIPRRRRSRWRVALASAAAVAAIALGLCGAHVHRLQWPAAQAWQLTRVEGAVSIDGRAADAAAALAPGSVLETGRGGTVRMRVARIGEMALGEDSRFVVTETRSGRHRTQLQHGRLWARIWAPPGSFGVSSPSGELFDLGCEFVMHARPDGSGSLTVRSGWVQVDNGWREVLVPQGARVEFGVHGEPGTPYDLGASVDFLAALRELDAQGRRAAADGDAARALVAASRPQDAISLLMLLQAYPQLADGPVFERMAALMPADARVTRAALRERGAHALSPWWDALPYPGIKRWWLQWPDAFAARGEVATLLDAEPSGN
ncbi:hypothetical protein [Pseudoxanthomonas suwonensis]|uniref:FecR protein domain-containing protein n=1 Tax=Pseudoxanthomonas suwonensis TaxID=314722 RepID=A0A0E3Z2I3_9GAMM|nr:hypothetical protein [Pseudoxanthomonas suwonensis]AKC86224.1 hypothetical protein WQ53_04980 [Pseudoxanthomonas suwonensis]